VTIVAAVGNETTADAVTCPGLLKEVVSVGGFVSLCSETVVDSDTCSQYWLDSDTLYGPFCGHRGCVNGRNCGTTREEVLWDGNAPFVNAEPDVLAPAIRASGEGGERDATLQSGTSFAAPLVTSSLVSLLGDLILEEGKHPSPARLRQAVIESSVALDRSEHPKYIEAATFDRLRSE
jgi:hypothetical protein